MKNTGIVRRIDDLGRVVIPREIRKNLDIKDGDPLELFVDGCMVCFQKYDTGENILGRVERLEEFIHDNYGIKNKSELLALIQGMKNYIE